MKKLLKFKNDYYLDISNLIYDREPITNLLFFQPGEIYEMEWPSAGGYITSSSTRVTVPFTLYKSIKNIKSITIKDISVVIRGSKGYIYPGNGSENRSWNFSDFSNVQVTRFNDNQITFLLYQDNKFYNSDKTVASNNNIIFVEFEKLSLSFN